MEQIDDLGRPVLSWTSSPYTWADDRAGQNHNLMFVQRQHHEQKMRQMKPPEAIEKLYQLEATRRQVMDVLKEEEGVKKNNPECSWRPEIDKRSEQLAGRLDPRVVNRVYHWQENKNNKLKEKSQRARAQEEQELAESTQKFKFVNNNFEVNSKVKNFVDSLDLKKGLTGSKVIYQSHGPLAGPVPKDAPFDSPIQYMSEPVQREALGRQPVGVRVFGQLPPEGVVEAESPGVFSKKRKPIKVGDGPELQQPKQLTKEFVRGLVRDI